MAAPYVCALIDAIPGSSSTKRGYRPCSRLALHVSTKDPRHEVTHHIFGRPSDCVAASRAYMQSCCLTDTRLAAPALFHESTVHCRMFSEAALSLTKALGAMCVGTLLLPSTKQHWGLFHLDWPPKRPTKGTCNHVPCFKRGLAEVYPHNLQTSMPAILRSRE
ncbi:hypothetical protein CONLIGDRAFT_271967 [Coniochaeta ligniaria NRRL 30616]|uniref:Uncharacterized protein n=1 Tax=Coniochaeta ligniaria NRRL 30616 TaxID=1408157 RepID=A0A1J7JXI6_9PEZI|nr:hypothetical protein CONLIGDRAFT_271967 [Coniochaeta ligniaria NRRL 30616]